jgi:peptidyl-Asp metalloendopeptidase
MFSVSNYNCATGYYSFGHEIGHNFNLFHDIGSENACTATTSYNFGYRDPKAEFRTILSYDCTTGECDIMPKSGCNRIQRFSNSNPAYKYNGKAIGNAQSDNAKQFNSERARVASFFPAMDCQNDSECNDNDSTTRDTCNIATRVCVFASTTNSPTEVPIVATESSGTFMSFFQRLFSKIFFFLN